eukprot:2005067-Rhodomonas_salina.1
MGHNCTGITLASLSEEALVASAEAKSGPCASTSSSSAASHGPGPGGQLAVPGQLEGTKLLRADHVTGSAYES